MRKRFVPRLPKPLHRINHNIRASQVRLIGADGEQVGVVTLRDALARAEAAQLDLVEVAPNAEPPVCRIEDYKKLLYEKKRKERLARKKQKNVEVKEVKVRPNIDPHDLETKMGHARAFLLAGNRVKITIMLRGREIAMADQRISMIKQRVMEALSDLADVESSGRMSARMAHMLLTPKAGKIVAKPAKPAAGDGARSARPVAAVAAGAAAEDEEPDDADAEEMDDELEDEEFDEDDDSDDTTEESDEE